MPIGHAVQSMSAPGVKCTSAPLVRLCSVEAEIASVYYSGDTHDRDPIMHMICVMLDDNKDMNPDDLIVVKTKLNIASPEEYSGSSDLEIYKILVTGIPPWLKMNDLLSTKHAALQVEYLGT